MWWNQATTPSHLQRDYQHDRRKSMMLTAGATADGTLSQVRSSLTTARKRELYYHHTAIDLSFELEQAVVCHQQQIEALVAALELAEEECAAVREENAALNSRVATQRKELAKAKRSVARLQVQSNRRLSRTHRQHDEQMSDCLAELAATANSHAHRKERLQSDFSRLKQENQLLSAQVQNLQVELRQQKQLARENSDAFVCSEAQRRENLATIEELTQVVEANREEREALLSEWEKERSQAESTQQHTNEEIAWYQNLVERLDLELEEHSKRNFELEKERLTSDGEKEELLLKLQHASANECELAEQVHCQERVANLALDVASYLSGQSLKNRKSLLQIEKTRREAEEEANRQKQIAAQSAEQLSMFESRMHDAQRQAIEAACRAAAAEQQADELRNANRLTAKRCELLEAQSKKLHRSDAELRSQHARTLEDLQSVREKMKDLESQRDEVRQWNEALIRRNSELQARNAELRYRDEASITELQNLKSRVESFRRQAASSEKRAKRIEKRSQGRERLLVEANREIQTRLEAAQLKHGRLKTQLASEQQRRAQLETALKRTLDRSAEAESRATSLEETLRELGVATAAFHRRTAESFQEQLRQREAVELVLADTLDDQAFWQREHDRLRGQWSELHELLSASDSQSKIERLEREIVTLQAKLRHEASQRRKAESALVRAAESAEDDPAFKAVLVEHQANQRIERMEKLLQATEDLNRYNQSRAKKTIRRLRKAMVAENQTVDERASAGTPQSSLGSNRAKPERVETTTGAT